MKYICMGNLILQKYDFAIFCIIITLRVILFIRWNKSKAETKQIVVVELLDYILIWSQIIHRWFVFTIIIWSNFVQVSFFGNFLLLIFVLIILKWNRKLVLWSERSDKKKSCFKINGFS